MINTTFGTDGAMARVLFIRETSSLKWDAERGPSPAFCLCLVRFSLYIPEILTLCPQNILFFVIKDLAIITGEDAGDLNRDDCFAVTEVMVFVPAP